MSLKNWAEAGWIRGRGTRSGAHPEALEGGTSGLPASASRGPQCGLATHHRVHGSLNAAAAALMASGYRADRDQHHYRTLQSLQHSIGLDPKECLVLDRFRKKRHVSTYDRPFTVTEYEVKEITKWAERILEEVVSWLEEHHPDLAEGGRSDG